VNSVCNGIDSWGWYKVVGVSARPWSLRSGISPYSNFSGLKATTASTCNTCCSSLLFQPLRTVEGDCTASVMLLEGFDVQQELSCLLRSPPCLSSLLVSLPILRGLLPVYLSLHVFLRSGIDCEVLFMLKLGHMKFSPRQREFCDQEACRIVHTPQSPADLPQSEKSTLRSESHATPSWSEYPDLCSHLVQSAQSPMGIETGTDTCISTSWSSAKCCLTFLYSAADSPRIASVCSFLPCWTAVLDCRNSGSAKEYTSSRIQAQKRRHGDEDKDDSLQ